MNIPKRFTAFVFSLLFFFSMCPFPVFAKNDEPFDLTGGIIVDVGSTALDVPETKLYPDEVQNFLNNVEEHVKTWEYATITVEKDGETSVLPMQLEWDYSALENPQLGKRIEICGTIIPPSGTVFSNYLSQQLYYYITIVPRPENVPNLWGGVVTHVNPSLGSFWRKTLEKGKAMTYFSDMEKFIADSDEYILVEKDGKTWPVPLHIEWNYTEIDDDRLGDFSLIGNIILPPGCTFAPDVLTQISIPVRVIETQKKIPLTQWKFTSASDRPQNLIIAPNDENRLKKWEESIRNTVIGCASEDGNYKAGLQFIKLDLQAVNLDVPGVYPVTAHFELLYNESDSNMDRYEPSAEVLTMPLLVKVSEPEKFELWNTGNGIDLVQLRWIRTTSKTPNVLYTISETALSDQDLSKVKWKRSRWEVSDHNILKISSYELETGLHYYFRIKDGKESSSIAHIQYDGTSLRNDYIDYGGDRDGGGGNDNALPPITQPMPTDPPQHEDDKTLVEDQTTPDNQSGNDDNTSVFTIKKTPLSTENTKSSPYEVESDTRSVWTGLRLNYACALKDTVIFVKGDVTLTFPSSVLQELKLSDTDLFEIAVTKPNVNSVNITIKVNGKTVSSIHEMKVQILYTPQDENSKFTVIQGKEGESISARFEKNSIQFTTNKTGTFTITEDLSHENTLSQASLPEPSKLLFGMITAVSLIVLLVSSLFIWRRRR